MKLFVLLLLIAVLAMLAGAQMNNDGDDDGDDNNLDPDPEEVPTQDDATDPPAEKMALNDTDTASTGPTSTLKNSNEDAATQSIPEEDETSTSSTHPKDPSTTTTIPSTTTTIPSTTTTDKGEKSNAFGTAPPMPTTIVACAMCARLLLLLLPVIGDLI